MKSSLKLSSRATLYLALLGLFASFIVGVECLDRARTKDFWMDEIFEVESVWPEPAKDMLRTGGAASPGKSFLYFGLQRGVMKNVLAHEKEKGKGWDWRVSMRFVPTAFFVVFCALAALVWLPTYPLVGALLPVLMSNYHSAIWFGAETRSHGPWAAAALLYYSITVILMMHPRNLLMRLSWIAMSVFMMFVGITSLLLVGSLGAAILLVVWLDRYRREWGFFNSGVEKVKAKQLVPYIITALVFCSALFFYWAEQMGKTSLKNFEQPFGYYVQHFMKYALEPAGGLKRAILLGLGTFVLMVVGYVRKHTLYLSVGILALSQWALLLVVYFLQILSGYFFAPRHGLFIVSVRALIVAALAHLAWELVARFFRRVSIFSSAKVPSIAAVIVVLLFGIEWWSWSLRDLSGKLKGISSAYGPYCHVKIPLVHGIGDAHKTEEFHFNRINEVRHSAVGCSDAAQAVASAAETYDFSPVWIYGK